MAHMVLLGPILDNQIPSFAFGNRWYRPIHWDRRAKPSRWRPLRYPLLTRKTYLPYARDHGLFRRVTHWTAARMVNAPIRDKDYSGRVQHPDDHDETTVPDWVRADWWPSVGSSPRLYWAALDIELAYPCVRLPLLERGMKSMVQHPSVDDTRQVLRGYPASVVKDLKSSRVRHQLVRRTIRALEKTRIDPGPIADDAWRPRHLLGEVSSPPQGLPTGLAISGLLFNAALHHFDQRINRELLELPVQNRHRDSEGHRRIGAVTRFADDMYLLARTEKELFSLIDLVASALADDRDATHADCTSGTNLYLNSTKTRPDAVKQVVKKYLRSRGWQCCEEKEQCDVLRRPQQEAAREMIADWWSDSNSNSVAREHQDQLQRASVGPRDLGPFVTTLVERMSEIGRDTLGDRFGQAAEDRLARLHDLARFDIDDEQVPADTRRTFAVNRLARVWLPDDEGKAARSLDEIRSSISHVLQRTPWKFSIWTAVVRSAARRVGSAHGGKATEQDREGRQWLQDQLRHITVAKTTDSWLNLWPEEHFAHEFGGDWQPLYISFHRAVFWRALAAAIRALWWHRNYVRSLAPHEPEISPERWTVRGIPESRMESVARFLGGVEDWSRTLYPRRPKGSSLPSWELDGLVMAILATHPRSTLARAYLRTRDDGDILAIPERLARRLGSQTRAVLHAGERVRSEVDSEHELGANALAQVRLGHEASDLDEILFPPKERPKLRIPDSQPERTVSMAVALNCSAGVGAGLTEPMMARPEAVIQRIRDGSLALSEYHRARRIHLANRCVSFKGPPTLYRLLWGVSRDGPIHSWRIRPWEVPAVGLPVQVAVSLFQRAVSSGLPTDWTPANGPLTWALPEENSVLASGRRSQFYDAVERPLRSCGGESPRVQPSGNWEVPPHIAYFLPFANTASDLDPHDYSTFCNVLSLLTAVDGGEMILDKLIVGGAGSVPFEDRWAWRSRIHFPRPAWQEIEQIIRWGSTPRMSHLGESEPGLALLDTLADVTPDKLRARHFDDERVDVCLDVSNDLEVVRTVRERDRPSEPTSEPLIPQPSRLANDLIVRIGQVSAWQGTRVSNASFPRAGVQIMRKTMLQVAHVFQAASHGEDAGTPNLVVLPELVIPACEAETVRNLVARTGRASLAGIYWRVLPPVCPGHRTRSVTRRWIVNEAELAIPVGYGERGPVGIRSFRVQKLFPSHIETGLARALTTASTTWSMLRGRRVYRFVHPEWGDFSIAICADLIEPSLWQGLRGELLHLFMVAFNRDVGLYESLARVRSYEHFANLIATNHGKYGGSLAFTPQHGRRKEVARLRGSELLLLADVRLPVTDLLEVQAGGVHGAEVAAASEWVGGPSSPSDKFKSPPPGFRRHTSPSASERANAQE